MPRLDENERSYYQRVESMLEDPGEVQEQLLQNVVDQILTDGPRRVVCDKEASRAVEKLLEHSSLDVGDLGRLLDTLCEDYCTLSVNKCGSHVVESLLKAVAHVKSDVVLSSLFSVCATTKNHLSEFITHPYASHVLSTLLQVLAGVYLSDHVVRSRYSKEFRKAKMHDESKGREAIRRTVAVPGSFLNHLDRISKRVCKIDNLRELLVHECANPVLQVLLRLLKQRLPKRGEKVIRKILKCPGVLERREGDLPDVFKDVVGSHLLETLIEVASPKQRQHIYDSCFRHSVGIFALHPIANFTLQQLIISANPAQVTILVLHHTQ